MKYINFVLLTALFLIPQTASYAARSASVTVDVSVTIRPVFELSVSGPANGNIEFGEVDKKLDETVVAESEKVFVTAKSNLREPYIISHSLQSPLRSISGSTMPDDSMTVNARSFNTNGKPADNQTVTTNSSVLFESDANGMGDTVEAQYQLKVASNQDPGTYNSKLTYSIVTA